MGPGQGAGLVQVLFVILRFIIGQHLLQLLGLIFAHQVFNV